MNDKSRITFLIAIVGVFFVILGLGLISNAYAVNQTAFDEIQNDLSQELTTPSSFPAFWPIMLMVILAFFMYASIRQRWDREMVFFSIGASIVSIILTLLFTAPVDYDFQSTEQTINIVETDLYGNGTIIYNSEVTTKLNRTVIIPFDQEFRFALMALFTGIGMFNGLYSIYIVTGFTTRGDWGHKSKD